MDDIIQQYFSVAVERLQAVQRESSSAIRRAAEEVFNSLQNDKDFLLFGSGHSTLIAHDAAGRAGGLMPAQLIEDIADGDAERIEGLAKIILGRYKLRSGSTIAIISNSGMNPVPIEMAMLCSAAGLTVIAVTSLEHSQQVPSRHSSGKKLYELADIVIDTHAIPGDAAIELPGNGIRTGALTTILGSAILQAITVQVAARFAENGQQPPIFVSANVIGGDAQNADLLSRYRSRLVRYQIPSYTA
jgi:uncharacterized phosphosugar-binding protein